MAESAGGVEFYVDADTQGVVQSTKVIKSENDKVTKSFKSVDTQVTKTSTSITQSFKGVETQVTKTSKAVTTGLSSVGRGAGQAGIQVQQFIGQIQGGQNAMLALSQQSADLGFVLGAPLLGAIVGIAASLAGILLPELLNSKDGVETLKKAIEQYSAVVTLSKEGNAEFTASLQAIASRSREVAEQLSSIAAARALIAAREAAKSVKDEIEGFGSIFGETFGSLADKLGLTREQLFALQNAANSLQKGATTERIEAFEAAIAGIGRTGGVVSKETLDFKEKLLELADGMRLSIGVAKSLKGEHKDFGNETEKAAVNVAALVKAVQLEAETYGKSDRALALYTAKTQGATEADLSAINTSYDRIDSLKAQEQAQKDAAAAAKKYNDETFDALKREETARQNADKKRANQEASRRNQLQSSAGGIADNFGDPIAALEAQKAKELEVLRQSEDAGLTLHTEYSELRANIDAQYAEREQLIREEKFRQESLQNELALSSVEALGAATTNTLSGLLSGTYSATEAMQQFANTILNSAIGALVDIGVQHVKNAIISQTADKAILASQAALKATNAAVHTAAVTATVAELSSLAAAGAFAATSAIPLVGPGLAPGAAALAAGATATLGSAAIASAPIAGARFNGGPVSAGKLYEVGEKNRPEMLQSGGKQYMIPGNNGNVTSNADMQRGGSAPQINVTVNNVPGQTAQVTQTGEGINRQMVIQIIGEQSAQVGSGLNRNINKNHNVTNRQGANRRN